MAKQSPSLYSISKTFVWFAIVSLALTGTLVATVLLDHHREWKVWQKKFTELKVQKAREELKKASQAVDAKKMAEMKKTLAEAGSAFAAHKADYEKALRHSAELEPKISKVKAQTQNLKQFQDSYKYYLEEYRLHKDPKAAETEAKLKKTDAEFRDAKTALEALEKEKELSDQQAAQYLENQKKAQKDLDKLLEEKTRIEKRIHKIEPSLAKDILNAPMLDFIAPSLQIQQIVLEDLQDDYHFAKVQKVDRCTTCHLGIDQKGFEDAPQPFRTHPNLDLYLGAASPHPTEKFGCTACHGGSGQAVSFVETAHTPRNEEQKAEWQKKYHWREFEQWDNKMLPLQHVTAACAKCHSGAVEVPRADKLNEGRRLARTYGCFNCHKVKGFSAGGGEDAWKVGPDLTHVGSKLREEWIAKWLENPKDFRPSTKMPRIYHLSNTSTAEDRDKNDAAIQSIAAYLVKNSERLELVKPPAPGDAANGEKLVKTLGCLGCHTAAGVAGAGDFGPELSGLGSKVSPEWLYSWLKDPKRLSPNTRMPNLRLSDPEASDITAYLLSLKNEPFEQKTAPPAKPEAVDQLILESLQGTMRQSEAEAELKKMNAEDKRLFVGKKSISQQGCFGCHQIKGFEDAKPIGAELSDEGRKDIHRFDFGFIDIEKTRQDWIHQKLKEPRIFDQGKIKSYYEKLRMPQFNFSEAEIEALTTFVLSLSEEQIPLQSQKRLNLKEAQIEKGRRLVTKLNCQGCHTLDGKTGTLRKITEDPGAAPPVLDGEGAKVQEKWLHGFLNSPKPIRPWISYRMPTFGLTEEELNTLVFYFHHRSNQEISFAASDVPEAGEETLAAGKSLFGTFQCVKCHQVTQDSAALGSSFLAPDLTLTKQRLKPEWVQQWLRDPQTLQEGTMMPTFFSEGQTPVTDLLDGDAEKQIKAIRDYLYRYETEPEKSSTK